ncbi:Variant surface glycoprotein [Trypanosoma congolense IL3000]|uniref:Variant surface glycoprotein n=1 Tax=Trypanosoma congolense (strain IL3000) TaxID=1068625 RepID=F9WJB0_TRYCI|nr:Variant surface glycoprotein [Trypanosoma congolense IL3000]
MMTMMVWMVMMVVVGASGEADEKDHNGPQHKALCGLLKAAVTKWGNSGEGLSDPLRKALGKTLFGKWEGDIHVLKEKLPDDYKNVEKDTGTRSAWCGQPHHGGETNDQNLRRWSGHSAPHDMVCLCTVGEKGWPLNESESSSETETTLCGQNKQTLGAADGKGWDDDGEKELGENHVNATWFGVTVSCLQGETGGDLKKALGTFLGKLEHKPGDKANPNRYQLGEGKPSNWSACDGTSTLGVCVMYYNSTNPKKPQPWWVDLQKAIPEEEKFQEEKKKREEEERRKQQDSQKHNEPRTDDFTSTPTTANQTEKQHGGSNLTEKLRKFNITSGTLISLPSSWLLSAAFLI